ncbi:organic radical activating enzyme [Robbsia andropogonis]|uniref:hypothetical protein n=1 Tax=Robbsia andropogonis TaxID=28092 RepID=UPI003D1C5352
MSSSMITACSITSRQENALLRKVISLTDEQRSASSSHKGIIWVYLNGRCNFTCDYCLDGRNRQSARAAHATNFVTALSSLQVETGYALIFTGGEPLIERDLLKQLFLRFPDVPKAIQTNASLPRSMKTLAPSFSKNDWLAISVHDESHATSERRRNIIETTTIANAHRIPVLFQLMCSPNNITAMLALAKQYRNAGHRTAMRRLFHFDSRFFKAYRNDIAAASSEGWAAPAFFEDHWDVRQPFLALNVRLDGSITAVCREEVEIGNLYTGYDLNLLAPQKGQACDSVCHCCSCLWVHQPSGFA